MSNTLILLTCFYIRFAPLYDAVQVCDARKAIFIFNSPAQKNVLKKSLHFIKAATYFFTALQGIEGLTIPADDGIIHCFFFFLFFLQAF